MFKNVNFVGTVSDFVENGVKINGRHVDAVSVSALARHGLIKFKGFGVKPTRGKTPSVYEAVNREGFEVEAASMPESIEARIAKAQAAAVAAAQAAAAQAAAAKAAAEVARLNILTARKVVQASEEVNQAEGTMADVVTSEMLGNTEVDVSVESTAATAETQE